MVTHNTKARACARNIAGWTPLQAPASPGDAAASLQNPGGPSGIALKLLKKNSFVYLRRPTFSQNYTPTMVIPGIDARPIRFGIGET